MTSPLIVSDTGSPCSSPPVPFMRRFMQSPMSGPDIEAKSFAVIDAEASRPDVHPAEWEVMRRAIHTTGDISLGESFRFSHDPFVAGIRALQAGVPIFCDSNMIRAGISLARLRAVCPGYTPESLHCHVADPDVAAEAKASRLPRSLFALRKARPILDGGIAVFGNAPVALLELNRLIIEEGIRPALVIGMPVGFVHVNESKEELVQLPIPSIVIEGRRGGSPLAVSTIHAVCTVAGWPSTGTRTA